MDHFSLAAPFYDRFARLLDPTRLRSYLALPVAGRLLDAGGGTGRVAQALCGQARQVVIVDISVGMLAVARKKTCLHAVRAPVERLPFPDGAFARAIVVDAFHHFADHRAAVAEIWRVLEPGGRLVIEEPNIETMVIKLIGLAERVALMRSRFYSPRDMAQMIESLGARVEVHDNHTFNAWIIADKVTS